MEGKSKRLKQCHFLQLTTMILNHSCAFQYQCLHQQTDKLSIHILLTSSAYMFFGYFIMSLVILHTLPIIQEIYELINDSIPTLLILCMCINVAHSLVLHGFYTPRIIRFTYISGCILYNDLVS